MAIKDALTLLNKLAISNRFEVIIPGILVYDQAVVKTVSIPEVSRQEGEYFKYGVKFSIPLEIQFTNEISITFYQTVEEGSGVRESLLKSLKNNEIISDITVIQKGISNDTEISKVKYFDVFVKNVSSIEMTSSGNEVPEYTVTFAYNWHKDDAASIEKITNEVT